MIADDRTKLIWEAPRAYMPKNKVKLLLNLVARLVAWRTSRKAARKRRSDLERELAGYASPASESC